MIQQFNALHAALGEEINDIRNKMTSENTNNSRSNYLYADGSVVLPVSDSHFDMVGAEYRNLFENRFHYEKFITTPDSMVKDEDILKIPNANKKLLAVYANMMAEEENIGVFYGMLVIDGDMKINPLHPVIAAMITAREIRLSDKFTIIVYPYSERKVIDADKLSTMSKEIINMIPQIRDTQYIPSISYVPSNSLSIDIKNMVENTEGTTIRFRESGDSVRSAIIPVQLTTKGIVYPYYGLVHSQGGIGDSYVSRNLYPCLSGNIDTTGLGMGTTCVGDLSSSAFASLYVLSNMNIRSLYFPEVYTELSVGFIQACQNISAEFLSIMSGVSTGKEDKKDDGIEAISDDVEDTTTTPGEVEVVDGVYEVGPPNG